MQVVILAGGNGSRMGEAASGPKPMVEIGGRPILWHIMKCYARQGFKDFVVCLGYKGDVIRDYFLSYFYRNNDVTVSLDTGTVVVREGAERLDWRITLAETGQISQTGGRLKRAAKYIDGPVFMATYGDGVANVSIPALLNQHKNSGKMATVTGVRYVSQFGEMRTEQGLAVSFAEKPVILDRWVNGGFMVFERSALDLIQSDGEALENVLRELARRRQLAVYQHSGFWQCMDTPRDAQTLNELCREGRLRWFEDEEPGCSSESATGERTVPTAEPVAKPEPSVQAVRKRAVRAAAVAGTGKRLAANGHAPFTDNAPSSGSCGSAALRADRNGSNCLGCGTAMPPPFLDLGCTPLANSYLPPDFPSEQERAFPLAVAYCPACHLVQLNKIVPPEQLFSEYAYFSSYSASYLEHAMEMAGSLISRFSLGSASRVLEIGSNDGYLLKFFQERRIPVLGVEPARNIAEVAEKSGIPTLNSFFGPQAVSEVGARLGDADLIIANNVLAHVPQINDFLGSVRACLRPGGCAVFEFPYLLDLLENCEFDTIYHEHVFYYSLSAIELLARRSGLRLVDVEHQQVHGGSLRVFLSRGEQVEVSAAVTRMLNNEVSLGLTTAGRYEGFSKQVESVRIRLLDMLLSLKAQSKVIAAYGAPAKGNTLLNYCGIGRDLIEFTVDRNPHKQGRLLPGSRIPILSSEELLSRMPDCSVILPWNIADEVMAQEGEYVRRGGKFILPIPEPHIAEAPQRLVMHG